ncbi:MAG: type II secretion system protein [Chlamydiales bacterium]|nr:type II secretion system protein [Chlamydiales bacterium]
MAKQKKYSFALLEVIVSIAIISVALGFFVHHIYRFANHQIHQLHTMDEFRIANNLSLEFEMNVLPEIKWDEMNPIHPSEWELLPTTSTSSFSISYKRGYSTSHETCLADNTKYRLFCYYLRFDASKTIYKYSYILKKE